VLVDRPVHVRAPVGHSMYPRRLDELEREPLDSPVHGDVVDGDAALGQQLLDVPVGQPGREVSADRDRDHLPREPQASEHWGPARGRHRTSSRPPRSINATLPSQIPKSFAICDSGASPLGATAATARRTPGEAPSACEHPSEDKIYTGEESINLGGSPFVVIVAGDRVDPSWRCQR
jgi:hypothetical protein